MLNAYMEADYIYNYFVFLKISDLKVKGGTCDVIVGKVPIVSVLCPQLVN